MKKFNLYNETFLINIPIFFYEEKDHVENSAIKRDSDNGIRGWVVQFNNIWELHFNFLDATPENIPGIIAHECFHMTNRVLMQRGIRLQSPDYDEENPTFDETHAYFLAWLVNSVHKLNTYYPDNGWRHHQKSIVQRRKMGGSKIVAGN